MLILNRRVGESLMIGEVEVTVVETRMQKGERRVVLGVTAPRDVTVNRLEVHQRMQEPNRTGPQRNRRTRHERRS